MVTANPSDRRSSIRRPIKLPARLEIEARSWPCEIADFCAEGLFLRYSSDTAESLQASFATGSPPVRVLFRETDSGEYHSLQARPVRRINGAMGVEFTHSNPRAVEVLLDLYAAEQGGASAEANRSDQADFILRQCTRASARYVEPLVGEWFAAIDRQLAAAAQQATDQLTREYGDAALALRTRQRPFWHMMNQAIEAPAAKAADPAAKPGFELNLVDKSEFEDWLLLRVMVTKAETQFRGALLQLRMRLDKVGLGLNSGHQNPLGPILVCDAFRQALEHLDCSRAVDKLAFRVFEQEVVKHLGGLYEELNRIFVRHGILPDLDLTKYLAAHSAATTTPPNETTKQLVETGPRAATPAATAAPAEQRTLPLASVFDRERNSATRALATVERLMLALRQGRVNILKPDRTVAGDPPPLLDSTITLLTLTELQHELDALAAMSPTAMGPSEPGGGLRERVEARLGGAENKRLDPEQDATLDVVDQFFVSLDQSPRLSDTSRLQLHQLGVPVLRAVLREREAFEDEDSAVRGVLNRIAQLGLRGGRLNPVVQRRVDHVVERINRQYAEDPQVFESALGELDELVARQNLAYRRNVERVTAAAEGAQKVEEARQAVSRALAVRISGQAVPRALLTLLNEGWRDLLALTHVRQGPESSLWHDYLAVVDTLLAFARDPEMSINLADLLKTIQDGLASISSNQKPAAQLREELRHFLTRRDSPASELVDMPGPEQQQAEHQEAELSREGEHSRKGLQRWINQARELQSGEWMKLQEDPDNPSFMRLVWIGRDHSRFVFVNHQGMKLVEFELEQMADHMRKGIVVSDPGFERPVVDESIDRMVRQVYEQASQASTRDPLTGLLSRREFERCLGQWLAIAAVADARAEPEQKVLVVIELQQLRELSDTAGFEAGDDALRQVARLLQGQVGDDVDLARLGGPRFGLLLNAADAETHAEGLIAAISALPLAVAGRQYSLGANAGMAIDQPGLASPEQWLAAVEDVLVRCRRDGRSGVVWHVPEPEQNPPQARMVARFNSVEDVARERILLRSQKILPLHGETRLAVQHQVLFSVYDESGELMQGAGLARMAERHKRIQTVDRWLVGHLLDWMARNPYGLQKLGSLGIALSASSLADAKLLESVFERMSRDDAPIEHLWFEVAEAAARDNTDRVIDFMTEMNDLGCHFCLSQFSGRPDSYKLLERLPVTRIKLDGTFAADLLRAESDQVMVRSMVEMAHMLGREVIACDVEDRETLDLLIELGLDYAQGNAIERPRALDA